MKKLYSIVIIFGLLMLISNTVFASNHWKEENEKMDNAIRKALDSYMQTFMTENTSEQDRIKDYIFIGGGRDYNEDKLKATISFYVTSINENNTSWNKHKNICFAEFSKINNQYVLDKISRYPDNYDEFLERFEEYKKNNPTVIESTQIQGEEMTNNLANQEIDKMSNIIFISCSIVLLAVVCLIIKRFSKIRR